MNRNSTSRLTSTLALLTLAVLVAACDEDGDVMQPATPTTFEVTIENVSQEFDLIDSGVFNTPVGASAPGPLPSGMAYEATFTAGPGHSLHFATMFVQSNDLFYAPDEDGIALYDAGGNATAGDVTSHVRLWDAGTEVDQEPGTGADQAPRQAGPDTGADDATGTVRLDANAFGNLPAVSDAITVTLDYLGDHRFTLRIENVASDITTTAGSAPVLLAPGVYAIGSGSGVLFMEDQPDFGEGLEAIAEDGNPATLAAALGGRTGVTSPIAPGVWTVQTVAGRIFTSGSAASAGLEALAEDGDPSGLASSFSGVPGISSSGVFNTPVGAGGPAPAFPGESYSFTVSAVPGDALSFATMLVQSNDLFYAPAEAGIPLFSGDRATSGDVTSQIMLWDAGTEVNEAPGAGINQAPRQAGPNTGATEGGTVGLVSDGFTYPSPVLRVTITPTS